MIVLSNFMLNIIDNFNLFYDKLTDSSKMILYVIIILLLIASMILLIIIDQKKNPRKVVKVDEPKKMVEQFSESNFIEEDEENEKTRNLKEITQKIQEVMDGRNIELTHFEQEQEENSIISYEELLKHSGQKKAEYTEGKFELPSLVKKIEVDEIIEKEAPILTAIREDKFKKSDFISPIFGIQGREDNHSININMKKKPEDNHSININDNNKIADDEVEMLFPEYKKEEKTIREISNIKTDEEKFLTNLKALRNNLN